MLTLHRAASFTSRAGQLSSNVRPHKPQPMLLLLLTTAAFAASGVCLAYLAWARANERRSYRSKAVLLLNTALIFAWGYASAPLISSPVSSLKIVILSLGFGLLACWVCYRLMRRHLDNSPDSLSTIER